MSGPETYLALAHAQIRAYSLRVTELEAELEAAREERDRAVDTANAAYSYDSAVRQANQQLREALRMLWDHYLLVINDEQKAQVQRALAASGVTEEQA